MKRSSVFRRMILAAGIATFAGVLQPGFGQNKPRADPLAATSSQSSDDFAAEARQRGVPEHVLQAVAQYATEHAGVLTQPIHVVYSTLCRDICGDPPAPLTNDVYEEEVTPGNGGLARVVNKEMKASGDSPSVRITGVFGIVPLVTSSGIESNPSIRQRTLEVSLSGELFPASPGKSLTVKGRFESRRYGMPIVLNCEYRYEIRAPAASRPSGFPTDLEAWELVRTGECDGRTPLPTLIYMLVPELGWTFQDLNAAQSDKITGAYLIIERAAGR